MSVRFSSFVVVFGIASTAYAHEGATGIVKDRMDGMKVLSKAMKAIATETQSFAPNAQAIKEAAQAMQDHAGDAMTNRFPKGSMDHPSEASEAIWEDWDRFAFLAQQLDLKANGLALAADNPITGNAVDFASTPTLAEFGAMGPDEVFSFLGKNCKDCHRDFRIKKD